MRRALVSAAAVLLAASFLGACGAPGGQRPALVRKPAATTAPLAPRPRPAPSVSGVRLTLPAPAGDAGAPPPSWAWGGDWGGAGPVALAAAAPDGRWLAVCEARTDTNGDGRTATGIGKDGGLTGDVLAGYFIQGGGPGEPIEAFVGNDPSGRWVALVRGGRLALRDTTASTDTLLDADLRDDAASFGPSRIGGFDPPGRRFLYHRRKGGLARVVVRELVTGVETEVDPGPGDPHRAELDATSDWVTVRVAVDSSGNGRIDWPVPSSAPFMRCNVPATRLAAWNPPRDDIVTRVAHVGDARAARDAPGLVVPFGSALVIREPDGALTRVEPDGARRRLVEASCAAKVLHAAAERSALLVSCQKKNGRMDVRVLSGGTSRPLGLELGVAAQDRVLPGAPRLIPLHPGSEALLVDLDGGGVEKLTAYDRIVATSGAWALVVRGKRLVLHQLGGPEIGVPGELTPFGSVLRAGNVIAMAPSVVDLATAKVLGTFASRPLAVSSDGRLLVASGRAPDGGGLAQGPLRWVAPAPGEGVTGP